VLVRDIGYLAAGADALRHFTVESIEGTLQQLEPETAEGVVEQKLPGLVMERHNLGDTSDGEVSLLRAS